VELHKPEAIVNHYIYMEAIKLSEYISVVRHPPVRPEPVGASDSGHPLWGPVVTRWRLEGVAGALPPLPLVTSARVLLHGKGRRENARSKARKGAQLKNHWRLRRRCGEKSLLAPPLLILWANQTSA
jgi:hypothetical protein